MPRAPEIQVRRNCFFPFFSGVHVSALPLVFGPHLLRASRASRASKASFRNVQHRCMSRPAHKELRGLGCQWCPSKTQSLSRRGERLRRWSWRRLKAENASFQTTPRWASDSFTAPRYRLVLLGHHWHLIPLIPFMKIPF